MKILREIRRMQKFIDFIISKIVFFRLIREIFYDVDKINMNILEKKNHYRIQRAALKALQKTTKCYLFIFFSNKCIIQLHYYCKLYDFYSRFIIYKLVTIHSSTKSKNVKTERDE